MAVCAIALVGCTTQGPSTPKLRTLGTLNWIIEGSPHIPRGRTTLVGSMIVCLDRPGVLHLTRVLALGDHELQVVGFGLRPSPFWTRRGTGIGDEKGGLAQHHFPANHTARLVCDRETGRAYELGVALRKTTAGSSRVSGFEIDYEVDGHSTHFDYRLGIVLCGGALGHDTFNRPTCA